MKKSNELNRAKMANTLKADFCWIFLPNGDMIMLHDEMDYSQYLHEHYTSKSNEGM